MEAHCYDNQYEFNMSRKQDIIDLCNHVLFDKVQYEHSKLLAHDYLVVQGKSRNMTRNMLKKTIWYKAVKTSVDMYTAGTAITELMIEVKPRWMR